MNSESILPALITLRRLVAWVEQSRGKPYDMSRIPQSQGSRVRPILDEIRGQCVNMKLFPNGVNHQNEREPIPEMTWVTGYLAFIAKSDEEVVDGAVAETRKKATLGATEQNDPNREAWIVPESVGDGTRLSDGDAFRIWREVHFKKSEVEKIWRRVAHLDLTDPEAEIFEIFLRDLREAFGRLTDDLMEAAVALFEMIYPQLKRRECFRRVKREVVVVSQTSSLNLEEKLKLLIQRRLERGAVQPSEDSKKDFLDKIRLKRVKNRVV